MPYVERNQQGLIYVVMNNPADENTEWVDPGNDGLNWFNTKRSKLDGLSFEYKSRMISITSSGVVYPVIGDLYQSILCRVSMATQNSDPNVTISDVDLEMHTLATADANTLVMSMDGYIMNVEKNKASLKDAINASTTLAEIQAVDVTAGWPNESW